MASPGLAVVVVALAAYAMSPSDSPGEGKRIESASYTDPPRLARCIAYNINKKRPDLSVRSRASDADDESILLILTRRDPAPSTYGVIRVEPDTAGSRLTTWLAGGSISTAADEIAQRLVAGC